MNEDTRLRVRLWSLRGRWRAAVAAERGGREPARDVGVAEFVERGYSMDHMPDFEGILAERTESVRDLHAMNNDDDIPF